MPEKHDDSADEPDATEREEHASLERRAEWWRLRYGDEPDVEQRRRDAIEQAERQRRDESG